jgi:alpha-tubulin suppressor-like RCC1 family protein
LFITSDDKVYGFGQNSFGCCGLGHNSVVNEPQVIPELCHKNIKQFLIVCDFYLALNIEGHIYGWGRNDCGQLAKGYNSSLNEFFKPEVIDFSKNIEIKQMSCGSSHTLALTTQGEIYGWGSNEFGQIGCGEVYGSYVLLPIKLHFGNAYEFQSVVCNFRRSYALTSNGFVLSWGQNEWCCLGHELENDEIVFKPKLIDISNVKCISFTGGTTYLLTNDGLIYFCGVSRKVKNEYIYEKLPIILKSETKFESLHFVTKYKRLKPLASAIAEGNIYDLKRNSIIKTKYKTFFDYYTKEHKITDKTVYMSEDIWAEEESVFERKHFEVLNKLDSGTFGQVFKVKHQLDQQFYAIKCIDLPGIHFENNLTIDI